MPLSPLRRSFPTVVLALLAGCAAPEGTVSRYPGAGAASLSPPLVASTASDGDAAMSRGDFSLAVVAYQQAANDSTTTPANAAELRLRAADAAYRANDFPQADSILDQIPAQPLDARQQVRYRLLRAQTALARNDAARALRLLPAGDPGGEPALAERQLMVRGRAAFRLGDTVNGVNALVTRERYLGSDRNAIAENREALWAGLTTAAPIDSATLARASAADPVTRGWVELAMLARRNSPLSDYQIWRERFPGHPGEERLATLMMPGTSVLPPVAPSAPVLSPPVPTMSPGLASGPAPAALGGSAALLLPQTGALTSIAEAVRAGYVSAASRAGAPAPHIYDVANVAPTDAVRQAASEGAGFAVGPLLKDHVNALAAAGTPPLPILALNYLDAGHPAPAGLYQFGLAPEDEARAAAEDASSRGLHSAIALVPNTEWGARVLGAFQQRFTELGGRLVESGRYYGEPQLWSDPVRKLLRYTTIDDKKKLAEIREKAQPGIDPQRRNDFDVIFIGAKASQARILWPLFRFYRADRMPIYATGAVNEGAGDNDLAGIRFCDAPWLLDDSGTWSTLRTDANAGRNRDTARLFALGSDAFLLSQRIAQAGLHPGDEINGATGVLRVDGTGVIHRSMPCAQTTAGQPFLLGHETP